MKKFVVAFLSTFFMVGCTVYKPFVQVEAYSNVPVGSKEIIFEGTIDSMKTVFKKNGILYNVKENGLETEEILIDEGTRAKYQVIEYEGNILKIIPFWGITDKVKSQMVLWAGADAASAYSTDTWNRVNYKSSNGRAERVFHYGIHLAREVNPNVTYK